MVTDEDSPVAHDRVMTRGEADGLGLLAVARCFTRESGARGRSSRTRAAPRRFCTRSGVARGPHEMLFGQ